MILACLPETRFLLEPLLLQPTMSSLLSDGRFALSPDDASRLRSLPRDLQLELFALRHQLGVLERSRRSHKSLDAVSKPRMARFAALQNRVAAFVDLAHARQPNEFSVPLSRRLSSQAHIRRIRELASW